MAYGFENDKEKVNIENIANEMAADKVDKVSGKGLSENNFTTADKNIISGLTAALATKVDKIPGKGLTTLDFTNTYKTKIEESAYSTFGNGVTLSNNSTDYYSRNNPYTCPHDGFIALVATGSGSVSININTGVNIWVSMSVFPSLSSETRKTVFVKKNAKVYSVGTTFDSGDSKSAIYYPLTS